MTLNPTVPSALSSDVGKVVKKALKVCKKVRNHAKIRPFYATLSKTRPMYSYSVFHPDSNGTNRVTVGQQEVGVTWT